MLQYSATGQSTDQLTSVTLANTSMTQNANTMQLMEKCRTETVIIVSHGSDLGTETSNHVQQKSD